MANVARRWFPLVLIVLAASASIAFYDRVPPLVELRLDGVLPFASSEPERPVAREFALFLIPALTLVIWGGFRVAPTGAGARFGRRLFRNAPDEVTSPEQFARFDATYDTIVLGVVLLLLGLHAAFLAAALHYTSLAIRIIPIVVGASLVLMGNVVPRLRPNWVAGLRTRRLLENPQLWREAHRVYGTAFVVTGLVTIVVGVIAPNYGLVTGILAALLSSIVGFVASVRSSRRATTAAVLLGISLGGADVASAQASPSPASVRPPATVAETTFTFSRDSLVLEGTLATPSGSRGPMPVVLIVAGSGATDRNANGPMINTNAYAMLAWGLAEKGIASFRYDKRGIGRGGLAPSALTQLSVDDYVADVAAAAAALAARPEFSKVFLLGHSEGAGHVLMAANRGTATGGVIMVSPQGRRLTEVLHEQFSRQADSATVTRIDTAFARFLRGEPTGPVPPIAQGITLPMYRTFLRSLAAYDPPAEAKRLMAPLLIVQGSTDVQITMRDTELLAAAQPRATVVRLENVNHVLKVMKSAVLADQMTTYKDPALPLAPEVVPAIAGWIAKQR